ncbi:hypothetical protein JAAARDRAFT_46537 [Jaapia argillacea MUCL 33604]|uniref:Serine-threonine/tyrosine-protein kinase catalytic domain-containing protein n=1 Tax=Jaapia argillacea MUCL 33604 TaxID=933084 RepID=A0A067Q8F0_9AGAM|nr:hypothetical protein JAAARDRAFT_46537 [Jaapia argillacea MUCL 33604]
MPLSTSQVMQQVKFVADLILVYFERSVDPMTKLIWNDQSVVISQDLRILYPWEKLPYFSKDLYDMVSTLKCLSHPNVLPFLGLDGEFSLFGSICTIVPQTTHSNVLEWTVKNPLDIAGMVHLVKLQQIAEGLSYLHKKHILHYNLGVECIFMGNVDNDVQGPRPHISGFAGPLLLSNSVDFSDHYQGETIKNNIAVYGYVCLCLWSGGHIVEKMPLFGEPKVYNVPSYPLYQKSNGRLMPNELWNLIMLGWSERWEGENHPTMREIAEGMGNLHVKLLERSSQQDQNPTIGHQFEVEPAST